MKRILTNGKFKLFGAVVEDYLTFNRVEQRGIFILLLLLFGLVMANCWIPSETFQQPVNFTGFEREVAVFESAWQKAKEEETRIKTERFTKYRKSGATPFSDTLSKTHGSPKISFVVELNSADTFELQRLKGIGPAFARRIVGYRDRLGGFLEKRQILEVFGMDTVRYRYIAAYIKVNPDSIRKIDLNAVTFKELLRHPYFPFELTRAILLYRQKNKRFSDTGELRKVQGVNDSVFMRIEPYVQLGH